MVVIQADKVCKSFGINTVLAEASFKVRAGEKLGLVGRNGAGKTTLLRLVAGLETPDSGRVSVPGHVRIGYVEQNPSFESGLSVLEAVYEGFQGLLDVRDAIFRLSSDMGSSEAAGSPARLKSLMREYAALTEEFERADGYSIDSRVAGVLTGLGFAQDEWGRPVRSLSGGERTRIVLARTLLSQPDVLLLDEPTNHLDIPSVSWLEEFLGNYPGAVIVVSHDRHFLDRTINRVLEIEDRHLGEYDGNYSSYSELKRERLVREATAFELQQKEIARLESVLRRYTALSARNNKFARRAEDVRKKLARVERLEKPALARRSIGFSLPAADRSGDRVVILEDVAMRFGGRSLFSGVRLSIRRGEHVGIVGRNGVGKSTLLHVITGRIRPSAGLVRLGAGVVIGYYDQQHADLAPGKTVIEEVLGSTGLTPQEARDLLGRFMFHDQDVFRRIEDLSGGERNRVLLARLMASGCNLLVMDEPTNHLDIDSVEVLEKALAGFHGTLLVVSHDRYFLGRVADRILALEDGKVTDFPGGYAYYVEKTGGQAVALGAGASVGGRPAVRHASPSGLRLAEREGERRPGDRGLGRSAQGSGISRKRTAGKRDGPADQAPGDDGGLEALEREIIELEARIAQLNTELADLELYLYPDRMAEKAKALSLARRRLEECYGKWGSAADETET